MTRPGFLDPLAWFAGLPSAVISAGALITDPAGRVLLVKPNYRDYWTIPGGICEFGEPPHEGSAREVAEETGLRIGPGRLLVVDWSRFYGEGARPIMHFLFDGGEIPSGAPITVQESELDGYQLTEPAELAGYLSPTGAARTTAALTARRDGTTAYLPSRPG